MFLGELVYGDTGTNITITVRKLDGTAQDLTGASAVKLQLRATDGTTVALAGTVAADPTTGVFTATGAGTAFNPAPRTSMLIEARATWTIAGKVSWSRSSFQFAIVVFP